ncbi:hypothetical protein EB118_08780 [bacterium]|nr:hypothetical protein [bacterium]NDC94665.1 hypothetical protein [bacterium]NDD84308.1 hypothetical protein [bacterium]NDG30157.1 hypothetical protein [bacterium]
MVSRKLMYTCVFGDKKYITMLCMLMQSLKIHGDLDSYTEFVVFTHPKYKAIVQNIAKLLDFRTTVYTMQMDSIVESKCARLQIFDFIDKMDLQVDVCLYLDTDILCSNSINGILDQRIQSDILYAKHECDITGEYFGKDLFLKAGIAPDPKVQSFNSGILLFKPSLAIRKLFSIVYNSIIEQEKNGGFGVCVDQPFLNFYAITRKMYNVSLISEFITLSPGIRPHNDKLILCHFAGNYGSIDRKIEAMNNFGREPYEK